MYWRISYPEKGCEYWDTWCMLWPYQLQFEFHHIYRYLIYISFYFNRLHTSPCYLWYLATFSHNWRPETLCRREICIPFDDYFYQIVRSSNSYQSSIFCVLANPRETRRVDTYLSALFPEKSRSYLQKMIEEGKISCNGANFTKNKKIYRWDIIEISWRVDQMTLMAEDIPLEIIYENDDFAIISKDAGINTHPTPWEWWRMGTLVNALLYHFKNLGIRHENSDFNPSIINGVERPGIVHRLDKDTSWLIIIAKNDRSMHALQLKIAKRTIHKTYLALVVGIVKDQQWYIESFIGRDPYDRKKMTTIDPSNPKLAKTKFLNKGIIAGKYTLLEVGLMTGRTHQIRVHLSSIGYPILWDKVYGNEKLNTESREIYGLTRQWLHAYRLEFNLFCQEYSFEAPLKADLNKFFD